MLSFNRHNIAIAVNESSRKIDHLIRFLSDQCRNKGGIVYCYSRAEVEETYHILKSNGFNAYPYHAGFSPKVKNDYQDRFQNEENAIMVATIAFGMGVNKPNVRFVAHLSMPKSIESYYQEIGRAGRDGLPAIAWMVYNSSDISKYRYHLSSDPNRAPSLRFRDHCKLEYMIGLCESVYCRKKTILRYFGENMQDCGNCDNCIKTVSYNDATNIALSILNNLKNAPKTMFNLLSLINAQRFFNRISEQSLKTVMRQLIIMGYIRHDNNGSFALDEYCHELFDGKMTLKVRAM